MEHSILLAPDAAGQGLGRALLTAVEDHARGAGAHTLIGGVSAENAAGRAFHARMGYAEAAILRDVGWKFGRYIDLVLMQKFLADSRGAPRYAAPMSIWTRIADALSALATGEALSVVFDRLRAPPETVGRLHHRGHRAWRQDGQGRRQGHARRGDRLPPHLHHSPRRRGERRPRLQPRPAGRGGVRRLCPQDPRGCSRRRHATCWSTCWRGCSRSRSPTAPTTRAKMPSLPRSPRIFGLGEPLLPHRARALVRCAARPL